MNFYKKPLLLIGVIVIVAALVSWFLIPAWQNAPGGVFVLLATVIIGVLTAAKDTVELLNGLRNMRKSKNKKKNKPEPQLSQTVTASGKRSVGVIGDVKGSIQTGDNNNIEKERKIEKTKKKEK